MLLKFTEHQAGRIEAMRLRPPNRWNLSNHNAFLIAFLFKLATGRQDLCRKPRGCIEKRCVPNRASTLALFVRSRKVWASSPEERHVAELRQIDGSARDRTNRRCDCTYQLGRNLSFANPAPSRAEALIAMVACARVTALACIGLHPLSIQPAINMCTPLPLILQHEKFRSITRLAAHGLLPPFRAPLSRAASTRPATHKTSSPASIRNTAGP